MSMSDPVNAENARVEFNGLTHQCNDPECHIAGFVKTLRQKAQQVPKMDRPAYELVRLIEDHLNDADQVTDSLSRPNKANIWAIRELLAEFGGKGHRWSHPRCFDCDHSVGWHQHDQCYICGCVRTEAEVLAGERDEQLDDDIAQAIKDSDDGYLPVILCETGDGCTCGAPVSTPAGMHHDYCPVNPASRVSRPADQGGA